MRHGRRRDLGDTRWVAIAAIVGVIAVVAIAAVFFLGWGFGSSSGSPEAGGSSGSGVSPSTTLLTNKGIESITVKETTQVQVPSEGMFVEVEYLGSFSGTYGSASDLQKAQDSGNKLYAIEDVNSTITARFQKMDSSAKHEMTIQIWKDGKAVKYGRNSSAYGIVSLKYP
jgi:hypothetical protein